MCACRHSAPTGVRDHEHQLLIGDRTTYLCGRAKPSLLQALIATYGPVDGREATVDALSWAWEHWDRMAEVDHPVGYLYRVGQSATRRFLSRPVAQRLAEILETRFPDVEPGLMPALARLSEQQRTVVVLVHGYGWRQAEVARLLAINASTVRDYGVFAKHAISEARYFAASSFSLAPGRMTPDGPRLPGSSLKSTCSRSIVCGADPSASRPRAALS